jgi:pimeloyl-ACP methyl ester carboxylesterase
MPRAIVRDVELYYEVNGLGPTLLLIAAFGASSAIWPPDLLGRIARSFRVITFDNRGTGRSDKADA